MSLLFYRDININAKHRELYIKAQDLKNKHAQSNHNKNLRRKALNLDYHHHNSYIIREYLVFCNICDIVVQSSIFNNYMLLSIVLAGILVGLQSYKEMNSSFGVEIANTLVLYSFVAEVLLKIFAEGLITPTIIKAQDQDLFSISRTWKELVEKAKNKKLSPAEYSSGTFTISNLGMFGVQQFDAILPSGTGSILAIAASTPKVIQTKDGKLAVQKSMTVTITCDHRHIYGADAAEFLKDLAELIENQSQSLLMG
jgi:hypothetical protein